MPTKKFNVKQLGDTGEGSAVIATLNEIDRDNDITLPGAFGSQDVMLVPSHNWSSVPLGKGVVSEDRDEAIARFKFNLESPTAQEWHSALKFDLAEGKPLQQWSYGYNIIESEAGTVEGKHVQYLKKLDVFEISPVLLGAGVNTRTLEVKEDKQFEIQTLIFPKAFWDLAAAKKWCKDHDFKTDVDETDVSYRFRQKDPGDFTRLRVICFDPIRDTDMKDCKIKAVGGSLKSGQESAMTAKQKNLVSDMLKQESKQSTGLRMADEFESLELALDGIKGFSKRVMALGAIRKEEGKEGRVLSRANRNRLTRLLGLMGDIGEDIDKLLADTDPEKAANLLAMYERTRANINHLLRKR